MHHRITQNVCLFWNHILKPFKRNAFYDTSSSGRITITTLFKMWKEGSFTDVAKRLWVALIITNTNVGWPAIWRGRGKPSNIGTYGNNPLHLCTPLLPFSFFYDVAQAQRYFACTALLLKENVQLGFSMSGYFMLHL